jgi:regulator of sigma E protease
MLVVRGSDTLQIFQQVSQKGQLGIYTSPLDDLVPLKEVRYTFLQAFPAGFSAFRDQLEYTVLQIRLLIRGKVNPNDSIGGIITLTNLFSPQWDWFRFWYLTTLFSLSLAVMNILPVPGFDGGHIMFLLFEMITGRKPGQRFLQYASLVGNLLLLLLIAYVLGLDILRLFK